MHLSIPLCSLDIPAVQYRTLQTVLGENTILVIPPYCRCAEKPAFFLSCPPFVHQRQTDCNIQEPPATVDESVSNVVAPRLYDNIIYRKTRRPPAAYSPDIQAVAESCRADGGEEHAIALLPDIFPREVSERALTRKMTREEARKHRHHQSGASTPVYRMLLRSDDAGRSHCRLCAVGANQNGWKNAKDVLRHLKRDHFGLVHVCPRWLVQARMLGITSTCLLRAR